MRFIVRSWSYDKMKIDHVELRTERSRITRTSFVPRSAAEETDMRDEWPLKSQENGECKKYVLLTNDVESTSGGGTTLARDSGV